MDFETCKENLSKLLLQEELHLNIESRNEATIRLQLIDRMLFECLGWSKSECVAEDNYQNTYVDYSLGINPVTFLIEAKKEEVSFVVPAGIKNNCKIRTLAQNDINIKKAIEQAMQYCQSRGIPVGCVSNGNQYIVFIGSRQDGVPPMEGRAIVFSSLDDIYENFDLFWNCISKLGIESRLLFRELDLNPVLPPEKVSAKLGSGYPGYQLRNTIQADLQVLGGLFLEDMTHDPKLESDFQKECYCSSGALSQYALIGRKVLESKYSATLMKEISAQATPIHDKNGTAQEFSSDIVSANLSRRPVILLGDVGSGKTMFIRHFIAVEAEESLKRSMVIYIDFGKEPALPSDLTDFVLDACKRILLEKYKIDIENGDFVKGVYYVELQRFQKGIYGGLKESNPQEYEREERIFLTEKLRNRADHLKFCLDHITKGQQKSVVIFLDNVDQRPMGFQDQVFLIGHGLAQTWPASVFITLRPETFHRSKSKGSLSGYQPRIFTIAPPRVDLVLGKRLDFVLKQLISSGHLESLNGVSIKSENLVEYITVIKDSLKKNRELIEFVDNVSGGNLRHAIDFLTVFVGSGHVDTEKIFKIIKEDNKYLIPVHEFMRAIIYGDYEYYDPASSPIVNLFDISTQDGREHFLLSLILSFLDRAGGVGEKEGYIPKSELIKFCQQLGYTPQQFYFAFERAFKNELIDGSPKFTEISSIESLRITMLGAYTLKRLLPKFVYLDAVLVDTPIIDSDIYDNLGDSRTIEERLARAEIFRKYLDAQWNSLGSEIGLLNWPSISSNIKQEMEYIQRKNNSNRGLFYESAK